MAKKNKSNKKINFSGWLANTFDSMLSSLSSKMTNNLNNYTSIYNRTSRIDNSTDYLNAIQVNPQMYCDILNSFPYFNALVNVFADACYEIMVDDPFLIQCNDKQLEVLLNKAIKDFKIKDYVLKHLHDMFKHGCFTGLIAENEITDIIFPYKGEFLMKKGRLLSTAFDGAQIPFYDTFTYWYDTRLKNALTVEEIKKLNNYKQKNALDKSLEELSEKIKESYTNQYDPIEEQELLKQYKECIELDTTILQGKSYFDSSLVDIFRVYLRDYLYDVLSLQEYCKSQCITSTVASSKIHNETALEIINNIESLLNTDNINIFMSYSDPLQLINQINDN